MSEISIPQEYFEIGYKNHKGGCSVTVLSNQEFCWPLSIGQRLADIWPADMTFSMNPERPKDIALTDYIPNLEGVLLFSPRLVTFLRGQALPNLEFLPVTVLDHKGRVASSEYAIVNCCQVIDCVDQENSEFKWDGLREPSMVVERMVVNARALIDVDARMIRPRFVPGRILVRADVRQLLDEQPFTGLGFSREFFGDFKVYRRPR